MFLATVGGQRGWEITKTVAICMAQETGERKKKIKAVFEILVPNPALTHKKNSNGGIIQWLSRLSRPGPHPFVITHSTTLILTTRQHLCHSFSAPSQCCCKFKEPRFHLSIHYHSLFRWDLLQHHTGDKERASLFPCVGWWKRASSDGILQILSH